MDNSVGKNPKKLDTKMLPANLGLRAPPSTTSKKNVKKEAKQTEDAESRSYFKHEKWWLKHDIPKAQRCIQKECTFEPGPHPVHNKPRHFMSFVEKKILVKVLIMENAIKDAKGAKVYDMMINKGYLTHRSSETLRNCLRRTILFEIENYRLSPLHLKMFKELKN